MSTCETTTISMSVNPQALVNNMRLAFTNSHQYLAELMQNARRAGATYVSFDYDNEARSLTVTDNGRGVSDLQDLLDVANSGWDEQTRANESPYGIGFLSALFAAEHVSVHSNGLKVAFETESALGFETINVEPGSVTSGTVVCLSGGIDSPERALGDYARAFSIPVLFNGKDLERPHALDQGTFRQTDFGWVHLRGWDDRNEPCIQSASKETVVYLQDQMVFEVGTRSRLWNCNIVHLDPTQFHGRLPDRDTLIAGQQERAAALITQQRRGIWRQHLCDLKAQMAPLEFAESLHQALKNFGMLHLMNDLEVIPRCALDVFDGFPTQDADVSNVRTMAPDAVARDAISDGTLHLASMDDEFGLNDYESPLAQMYAYLSQDRVRIVENARLHADHWAYDHLVSLTEGEILVTLHDAARIAETIIEGSRYRVVFCASATLSHPVLGDVEASGDGFVFRGDRGQLTNSDEELQRLGIRTDVEELIVMPDGERSAKVVGQAESFIDEWDDINETALEVAEARFHQFVLANRPGQEQEALRDALIEFGIGSIDALKGRNFSVNIQDNGDIKVFEH